jgi:perosamine synthetase
MPSEPLFPVRADNVPLCVPHLAGNEWEYVSSCLDTGWVSSAGKFVEGFEAAIARRVGTEYAVATSSGTSALHVSLLVAGVQPGDEVIVSTLTFIAPANAIRYVGAHPVFVDAEPEFWQMDPERVRSFLENDCRLVGGVLRNVLTGRRVRALLPVHILGHPVDMDPLLDLAARFHLVVIEDATEALGSFYKDRPAGHVGDMACFSFNGNKIVTAGGGGAIVTDRPDWAERARYLTTQAKDDPLEYIHNEIGYNYRLTNIQAALGSAQLEQLDDFVRAKRGVANVYDEAFSEVPGVTCMGEAPWARSNFWLYTILLDARTCRTDSRGLLRQLAAAGIQTRPLWQPLHRSPAHAGATVLGSEVAERLNEQALSLPCSVGLTRDDQRRVVDEVLRITR